MATEQYSGLSTSNPPTVSPVILSWSDILIAVFGVFVIIITVAGNMLVVISYWQDRHIRSIPGNRFILSLSVADLMIGSVSLPLYLQNFILRRWLLGDIACKLYTTFDACMVTVGVLTVINISVDRYWIVTKKLKYRSFQTKRRSRFMIIASWLASLLVIPTLISSWQSVNGEGRQYQSGICSAQIVRSSVGSIIIIIIQVIVPSASILYLNISIFIHICLHDRRFRRNTSSKYRGKTMFCRQQCPPNVTEDNTLANIVKSTTSIAGILYGSGMFEGATSRISDDDSNVQSSIANGITNQGFVESDSHPELNKYEQGFKDAYGLIVPSTCVDQDECKPGNDNHKLDGDIMEESMCNVPSNITKILDKTHQSRELDPITEKALKIKQPSARFRIHETRQISRIQHAALMLSTLILAFVICWTPFAAVRIYRMFCQGDCPNQLVSELTEDLVWLNSTINPIIYAVTNPRFRKNFIRLLHMRSFCQNR